jgi:hypothetical protein
VFYLNKWKGSTGQSPQRAVAPMEEEEEATALVLLQNNINLRNWFISLVLL